MQPQTTNSPQAVARVVALGVVADACIDPREFNALENIGAYAAIGVTRDEFKSIAQELYADLIRQMREDNCIELLTRARIDRVLSAVDDPEQRLKASRLLAAVICADGRFNDSEFDLFAQVLRRWLPLGGTDSGVDRPTTQMSPRLMPIPPISRSTVSSHPALHAD